MISVAEACLVIMMSTVLACCQENFLDIEKSSPLLVRFSSFVEVDSQSCLKKTATVNELGNYSLFYMWKENSKEFIMPAFPSKLNVNVEVKNQTGDLVYSGFTRPDIERVNALRYQLFEVKQKSHFGKYLINLCYTNSDLSRQGNLQVGIHKSFRKVH